MIYFTVLTSIFGIIWGVVVWMISYKNSTEQLFLQLVDTAYDEDGRNQFKEDALLELISARYFVTESMKCYLRARGVHWASYYFIVSKTPFKAEVMYMSSGRTQNKEAEMKSWDTVWDKTVDSHAITQEKDEYYIFSKSILVKHMTSAAKRSPVFFKKYCLTCPDMCDKHVWEQTRAAIKYTLSTTKKNYRKKF